MGCFSLAWIEHLLIEAIIVIAVVLILKIIIPAILSVLGGPSGWVMQVINIVIWAIVLIFLVVVIFGLLMCVGHF
jgi:hypothetical protein